ncbi:MAG: toll/interleukin-1 receptor domain-containing protein [Xanthobacteraceae bacterium]
MITPRVFISYSWDDDEHKAWVRGLSEELVKSGVEVRLDQWHVRYGESFTQFMEEEVSKADHILVICTPEYARKSNTRRGGVGYEQQIVSGQIVVGTPRWKFIPIIRKGTLDSGAECAIPPHFSGISAIEWREDLSSDQRLEEVLRAVYAKPRFVPPPLGEAPRFVREHSVERLAEGSSESKSDGKVANRESVNVVESIASLKQTKKLEDRIRALFDDVNVPDQIVQTFLSIFGDAAVCIEDLRRTATIDKYDARLSAYNVRVATNYNLRNLLPHVAVTASIPLTLVPDNFGREKPHELGRILALRVDSESRLERSIDLGPRGFSFDLSVNIPGGGTASVLFEYFAWMKVDEDHTFTIRRVTSKASMMLFNRSESIPRIVIDNDPRGQLALPYNEPVMFAELTDAAPGSTIFGFKLLSPAR